MTGSWRGIWSGIKIGQKVKRVVQTGFFVKPPDGGVSRNQYTSINSSRPLCLLLVPTGLVEQLR